MGLGNALYLLETGVRIDAQQAHAMGFVQEVVPEEQALMRALKLAGFIASYPNFSGLCADRQAALATYGLSLDEGLKLEARVVRPTLMSKELAAGLARFAAGVRDGSPRAPSDGDASADASGDERSKDWRRQMSCARRRIRLSKG